MNVAYEFSRIKEAFAKVRTDMDYMTRKISDNYENFMREHYRLGNEVKTLSAELKSHIEYVKGKHLNPEGHHFVSEKEFFDLKFVVKELREELERVEREHHNMSSSIHELRKDSSDIKALKTKMHASELELHILKERLNEKDNELKQMKEVATHLFVLIEELSKIEKELGKKNKVEVRK